MATTYTGVPGNISSPSPAAFVTVPVDGDADNAASFLTAFQNLADHCAFLQRTLSHVGLQSNAASTGLASPVTDVASNSAGVYVAGLQVASASATHWATAGYDGKTWTGITSGGTTRGMGVIWVSSLSLFVGVTSTATGGTVGIETSPTGATWTARTVPTTTSTNIPAPGSCIAFGAGLIVAALANTGQVISSPDGVTWTARGTAVMTGAVMTSVIYAGGQFVAVSTVGATFTSPDGLTWTARSTQGFLNSSSAGTFNALAYNLRAGLYLALSTANGNYYTSPDAITWTQRTWTPGGGTAQPTGMGYAWGFFLAITSSGTPNLFVSLDGITWTGVSPAVPVSSGLVAKVANDRLFLGLGSSLAVSISLPPL